MNNHHYSDKQLKEASLLVFLLENAYECIEDIFDRFINQFVSGDREPELLFVENIEDLRIRDVKAPWILLFKNLNNDSIIVHYEGAYIGEFFENETTIFKNETMMREDRNFNSTLAQFFNY